MESFKYHLRCIASNMKFFFFSRMSVWLWVTLALGAFAGTLNANNIEVGINKILVITTGAWVGYWLDRTAFPRDYPWAYDIRNPDNTYLAASDAAATTLAVKFVACWIRRAVIMAACVLGASMGV